MSLNWRHTDRLRVVVQHILLCKVSGVKEAGYMCHIYLNHQQRSDYMSGIKLLAPFPLPLKPT